MSRTKEPKPKDFLYNIITSATSSRNFPSCCAARVLGDFPEDGYLQLVADDPWYEPATRQEALDALSDFACEGETILFAITNNNDQKETVQALELIGFQRLRSFRGRTGNPLTLWSRAVPRRKRAS